MTHSVNPIDLLCTLAEAPGTKFRASDLVDTYGAAVDILISIGALAPGPPYQTVICRVCDSDHAEVVEFQPATGRSIYVCEEAGVVTVDDSDLFSLVFDPEWVADWLVSVIPISAPVRRRVLVPGLIWHLGATACGGGLVTVVFARQVSSHAALDLLMSVLRPVRPADKGLVITTSSDVARQVQLPNGFEFLDLGDIAIRTGTLIANDGLGITLESVTLNVAGSAKKETIEPADSASIGMSCLPLAQGTVAQETQLKNWLVLHMTAAPKEPRPKVIMQRTATDAGLQFSARAFERSWRNAVLESGATAWSAPGRKPSGRIDTRS